MRNNNAKLTPSHNLQTIFIFCHRIICSEIWAYWIITDLVHRSFCSSSEWWLRGIRLAWEFYYCKLKFFNALVFTGVMLLFLLRATSSVSPHQSTSRRSAGISKDYSNTSSTSSLYLQCFVQTHLIVRLIKLLYIIHFCFIGADHRYLTSDINSEYQSFFCNSFNFCV